MGTKIGFSNGQILSFPMIKLLNFDDIVTVIKKLIQ